MDIPGHPWERKALVRQWNDANRIHAPENWQHIEWRCHGNLSERQIGFEAADYCRRTKCAVHVVETMAIATAEPLQSFGAKILPDFST